MTVNTNHVAALRPGDPGTGLWQRWIAVWNGDLAAAEGILDDRLISHMPGPAASARRWPGLTVRVSALRSACPDASFTSQAAPLVSGGLIAGRWTFTGTRAVGPDAAATVSCHGTDILRIEEGRIVEHWTNPDLAGVLAGVI